MKKFMLVLLAAGLIALAIIPTACKKVETPSSYSSYTLRGVTLSYPSDWSDKTSEVEKELGADYSDYIGLVVWDSPTDAAILMVMVLDLDALEAPDDLTDADKKEAATAYSSAITTLMDDPIIVSDEKTSAGGEWAWETEFNGKIDGVSAKGYGLIVFHNRSMAITMYAADTEYWTELGGVYDTVKGSIKFQ